MAIFCVDPSKLHRMTPIVLGLVSQPISKMVKFLNKLQDIMNSTLRTQWLKRSIRGRPSVQLLNIPKRCFSVTNLAQDESSQAKTYQVSRPPRLRFAPSPTGQLHLGGLRTALFNHLFARKYGGQWILRIEDTDQSRYVPGSIESLQESLSWAGLTYDEGPSIPGGSKGPYIQSERLDLYKRHSEQLISAGKAYRDFRPPSENSGKAQGRGKRIVDEYIPPDEDEARQMIRDGKSYVVRLKTTPQETKFSDLVFGEVTFGPDPSNDPILMKSDGWPTYHLANVVDDHEMGITHVLRGEEWLPSVPKHLSIYSALSFEPPTFVHLPLLISADGSKLSKRTGDVHIEAYREKGYEPESLINFIALMGYNHRNVQEQDEAVYEVKSMTDLIDEFDPLRISPSRSALSIPKLQFLNKRHISLKINNSLDQVYTRLKQDFEKLYPSNQGQEESFVKSVIQLLSGRIEVMKDLPGEANYFFVDPDWTSAGQDGKKAKSKQVNKDPFFSTLLENTIETLSQPSVDVSNIEQTTSALAQVAASTSSEDNIQTRMKKILRFALAKGKPGPDIESIIEVLGRQTTIRRLQACLDAHKQST
ncbi:unnamed protein product [Sympodiomycopsis kandeliae]